MQNYFSKNIYDVLTEKEELSLFLLAVKVARLERLLQTESPITVLAPSNSALSECRTKVENLGIENGNSEKAKFLVLNHIIPGEFASLDLLNFHTVKTLGGEELDIYYNFSNGDDPEIYVNNALIKEKDIKCLNGYLHLIDKNCIYRF